MLGIGKPDGLAENARLLETSDPPPDGRGGSADLFGERGVAEAGVALQLAERFGGRSRRSD
jgi:hypothetical protein